MEDAFSERLKALASAKDEEDVPRLLDAKTARGEVEALLASGRVTGVHDEIIDQLQELVVARNPKLKGRVPDIQAGVAKLLGDAPAHAYGVWAFFPWNGQLVHILPRDEFREVRSNRNQHRITSEEQAQLRGRRVGVIGLSLGGAIAMTMVQEGVAGMFRLTDFDRVSLTNMNRLRCGVASIGAKKTLIAKREIAELDPYLSIEVLDTGLDDTTLERFLTEGGKLDLVVEECDDLAMKIAVRERARALQIPVVMFTGDRGVIDIERFDREPERSILHGLAGQLDSSRLKGRTHRQMVSFFVAINDAKEMSARSAASLTEMGRTVNGGPQLASMTSLGAGLVTDVVRRILLGDFKQSGRFYLDPADVCDGGGRFADGAPPPAVTDVSPEATRLIELPPRPARAGVVDAASISWIVAHATLAPSGHNYQPWSFRFRGDALECRFDRRRSMPFVDFADAGTWLALGAALENIEIAAHAIGLEPSVAKFPAPDDTDLAYTVTFAPRSPEESEALALVRQRITNRGKADGAPLGAGVATLLEAEVARNGSRLQVVDDPEALKQVASLLSLCDRIALLHPVAHKELMEGMRFTRDEVETQRDGLDLSTMDIEDVDRAGMQLMRRWDVARSIKDVGGGGFLEEGAPKLFQGVKAVGLITAPTTAPADILETGRAVQRMWLAAQKAGYAVHPMTILPYFFARVERGGGEGFSKEDADALRLARPLYRRIFDVRRGEGEVFLFRLFGGSAPKARSIRRKLEDVLSFGG